MSSWRPMYSHITAIPSNPSQDTAQQRSNNDIRAFLTTDTAADPVRIQVKSSTNFDKLAKYDLKKLVAIIIEKDFAHPEADAGTLIRAAYNSSAALDESYRQAGKLQLETLGATSQHILAKLGLQPANAASHLPEPQISGRFSVPMMLDF